MESIIGKILCDRYRIVQELSQDDFSTVYLAEDLEQNDKTQCRIERLQPQYDNEVLGAQSWQKVLQTFLTQANLLKNISQHPQIPQLLDFFECDREFYLVSEDIKGENLAQKLKNKLIDEAEAVVWLQEIISILEFTHEAGIPHLNIQPSSLVQHQDGRKILTDFAAIKTAVLSKNKFLTSIINPDFSPAKQHDKSDFGIDIYALGKTIIYALTGSITDFIYAKSTDSTKFKKVSNSHNLATANIRAELAVILNKMVSDVSEQCYQSPAEILAELDFNHNVITLPPPFFDSSYFVSSSSKKVKKKTHLLGSISHFKFPSKIIWFLLALPFILASAIIFIGINKNSARNFASYVNDDYQFEIKYPQDWAKRQLDDPITGEIVVFASALENDADLFLEKVSIAVEYLSSEPTSLEQYTQTVFNRINQTKGSEIEAYEEFETTIDSFPARAVIYSRQEGKLQLKQMEAFTIRNNQVYIAIYTAERAKFSKFYGTVEKMIDSWEIQ
ncbi:MAG: PsbP-related protein [Pleurocapsa sp.]